MGECESKTRALGYQNLTVELPTIPDRSTELPAAQAAKPAAERGEARVSCTDPEARVMKMPDGGFRPAYNIEFATDTAHLAIAGVDVTNAGSEKAEMAPMLD